MNWLIGAVVIVMVSGLIATWMVGQSRSNREEDAGYSQGTGTKWIRLSAIYLICIAIVAVFLIILLNR